MTEQNAGTAIGMKALPTTQESWPISAHVGAAPTEYQESANTDKFWPAYFEAFKEFGEPQKTSDNPYFSSKYADINEVRRAVIPALQKHGFIVLQPIAFSRTTGSYGSVTKIVHAESGQWIASKVLFKPAKDDPQGALAAVTYSRRGGLQCLTACGAEDDDGNTASGNTAKKQAAPAKVGDKKLDEAVIALKEEFWKQHREATPDELKKGFSDLLASKGFKKGRSGSIEALVTLDDVAAVRKALEEIKQKAGAGHD